MSARLRMPPPVFSAQPGAPPLISLSDGASVVGGCDEGDGRGRSAEEGTGRGGGRFSTAPCPHFARTPPPSPPRHHTHDPEPVCSQALSRSPKRGLGTRRWATGGEEKRQPPLSLSHLRVAGQLAALDAQKGEGALHDGDVCVCVCLCVWRVGGTTGWERGSESVNEKNGPPPVTPDAPNPQPPAPPHTRARAPSPHAHSQPCPPRRRPHTALNVRRRQGGRRHVAGGGRAGGGGGPGVCDGERERDRER